MSRRKQQRRATTIRGCGLRCRAWTLNAGGWRKHDAPIVVGVVRREHSRIIIIRVGIGFRQCIRQLSEFKQTSCLYGQLRLHSPAFLCNGTATTASMRWQVLAVRFAFLQSPAAAHTPSACAVRQMHSDGLREQHNASTRRLSHVTKSRYGACVRGHHTIRHSPQSNVPLQCTAEHLNESTVR